MAGSLPSVIPPAAQYLGLVLMASSLPFLASGTAGFLLWGSDPREASSSLELLASGLLLGVSGFLLSRVQGGVIRKGDAVVITVTTWILVPLVSAVPLSMILGIPYLDALLETVAGWTTTGLTILAGSESSLGGYVPSIDEIPESVKLWRSLLQWEGGVGIVVFTVAFLARPGLSAAALYIAEGRFERLEASLKRSAVRMTVVYTAYTVMGAVLLFLAGMTFSDAVQHSMTAISTAGFSTRSESIGYYSGNYSVYAASLLVSFLGAMSFVDLDNILRLRFGRVLSSPEFKAIALLTVVAAVGSLALWYMDDAMREGYEAVDAVYNGVSSYITVGFSTASLEGASDGYKLFIVVMGMVGGSAFSTAGGIKVLRLIIAAKTVSLEADSIIKPSIYVPKARIGGRKLTDRMVRRSLAVIVAFIISYAALAIIAVSLYSTHYPTTDILFDVASALANIGLSTGVTSPEAPPGMKAILITGMMLGRLEILPFIVAIKYLLEQRK